MPVPLGRTTRRSGGATLAGMLLGVAALAAACKGGDRADRTADTAFAPLPDSTVHRTDSTAIAPGSTTVDTTARAPRDTTPVLLVAVDSAIGDSLYQTSGRCLSCHGPRGIGNASLGPSLKDSVRVDSDGSIAGIETVIRDGVAVPKLGAMRMPAFGTQLDAASIHRIAVYVYSLSHRGAIARDSAAARAALPVSPLDTTAKH
jgi:mono/diheme cytochrome c family protein